MGWDKLLDLVWLGSNFFSNSSGRGRRDVSFAKLPRDTKTQKSGEEPQSVVNQTHLNPGNGKSAKKLTTKREKKENLGISNSPQIWRSNQIYWAFVKNEIRSVLALIIHNQIFIKFLPYMFELEMTCLICQTIHQSYKLQISIKKLISFYLLIAIDLSAFNDDAVSLRHKIVWYHFY